MLWRSDALAQRCSGGALGSYSSAQVTRGVLGALSQVISRPALETLHFPTVIVLRSAYGQRDVVRATSTMLLQHQQPPVHVGQFTLVGKFSCRGVLVLCCPEYNDVGRRRSTGGKRVAVAKLTRCSRLKHVCNYATDGDGRKANNASIATASVKERNFSCADSSNSFARATGATLQHATASSGTKWQMPNPCPPSSVRTPYLGIPRSLIITLVDVYYANVYNASLLLHKRMFLAAIAAGTACQHVVLSVCAFALNFHQDDNERSILRDHSFNTEWADQAGKLAFQDIENPTEDHVVTFMNLALFWYSQGAWRRSAIHKG
ncbi:hypothetical protein CLCR_01616 [Cladophialophora carrionii]|uniref:Uncharacterized protein n=1 Tax=Cladophialophora carrionii TaxID=86049 RepID=A0A1C1CB70_9EURO|nr:hypothetical protein CLCR_01616 [Cladophialophora carrionii]